MEKKLFLRTFSILLLCMVLLIATACSSSSQPQTSSVSPSASAAAANTSNSAVPSAKYSPEITITWAGKEPVNQKYPEGESYQDNRGTRLIKERLGINVKYAWVAPSAQYDEKVNVVIASGEIPDAMLVNATQLSKLVDADLVNNDLQSIFDQNAGPTMMQDYNLPGKEGTIGAATYNGKLAAIPFAYSATGQGTQTLVLRADWMKALNLTPPKTIDELLKVLDAFKAANFDGKNDTIGLLADKDLNGLIPFFWCYHAYPKTWVKDDSGNLVYGCVQPGIKNALAKLSDMYQKGYIDKEFAAKDWNKENELLLSSRCGAEFNMQQPWEAQPLAEQDVKADFNCYPLPASDNNPVLCSFPSFQNLFIAVRKDYKYPEAVVKMINFQYDFSYGPNATLADYIKYNQDFDKGIQYFSWLPWWQVSVEKNHVSFELFQKNTPRDQLNPERQWIYDTMKKYEAGDKKQWAMARFFQSGEGSHYAVLDDMLASKNYIMDQFYGAPLPSMLDKQSMVDKVFNEMCIKIIMGADPVSKFDQYVADMNAAGLEQITKDVNAWYSAKKK